MTKTLLQKIQGLQYFRGLQDLRRILIEFLQTATALETNSVIAGEMIIGSVAFPQGSPFTVGKKYRVDTLQVGDNFTNIGYTTVGVAFIATGTTPTTWTNNSSVSLIQQDLIIFYNDLAPTVVIENTNSLDYNIKITNGGFVANKTFPNIVGGSDINIVDNNTINFNAQNQPRYFKIEVYN